MSLAIGPVFRCAECGQAAYGAPGEKGLCTMCLASPYWFEDPVLRRRIEPDPDWRPPTLDPHDPENWRCVAPWCGRRDALFRVSGYDEPFRGLCLAHLDVKAWRELHTRRNREAGHVDR